MISVVIPAYNCAKYIERTIESVTSQTYQDFEIIIVDDGSTDDTAIVLDRLKNETLHTIKCYTIPNSGAYAARLFGVSKAVGEWITFVDSDDVLPKASLSLLFAECDNSVDIIVGTLNLNGKSIFQHSVSGLLNPQDYINALLTYRTSIGPCGKLYRRSLFDLKSLDVGCRINQNEDMLMLLLLSTKTRKVKILPDRVVYNYIYNSASLSRRTQPLTEWFKLFSILDGIIEELDYRDEIKSSFAEYRIRTLYEQGVLKLNDFHNVQEALCDFDHEVKDVILSRREKKMLQVILSPLRRKWIGYKWTVKERCKGIIKKVLHYA